MKRIACKNMGEMNCDFVATGETAEEVKDKLMKHAMEVHAEKMNNLSEEEKMEMMKKIDELMEDA